MSWDRFHYLCRRYSAASEHARRYSGADTDSAAFSDIVQKVDAAAGTELYGARLNKGSMAEELMQKLGALGNSEQTGKAAALYGQLDCSQIMMPPPQARRAIAYIALLGGIFFFIASLYQIKVMPQMLSVLDNLNIQAPGTMLLFFDYARLLFAGVALLLLFALMVGFEVRSLFKFQAVNIQSWLFKALVPNKIREQYQLLVELLHYPVARFADTEGKGDVARHLEALPEPEQALELQRLLRRHGARLGHLAELYLRGVLALLAVVMVLGIFFFLQSAYGPIFLLGELV